MEACACISHQPAAQVYGPYYNFKILVYSRVFFGQALPPKQVQMCVAMQIHGPLEVQAACHTAEFKTTRPG